MGGPVRTHSDPWDAAAPGSCSNVPPMRRTPNKRGAGKGGVAVLWRVRRVSPALPDRER
jgi:hypothetical protein